MFGLAPTKAIKAGAVGAMLQTGALIRDLSVQELIAMMASLYPAPLDVEEVLDLTADSIGPAMGGTIALFAFLGGVWFPIGDSGVFHDIAQVLPSYWLVQASHVSLGGDSWGYTGWLVIALWTIALTALAALAYQRDTKRV